MSSSALRIQSARRREEQLPCRPNEKGETRTYFPDFRKSILDMFILLAQERMHFLHHAALTASSQAKYETFMTEIVSDYQSRFDNHLIDFAAFYQQSLHCLHRYPFLKTLLHLPKDADEQYLSISPSKELHTPNGTLFVIAPDGRVLMDPPTAHHVAPHSELIPSLVQDLFDKTGHRVLDQEVQDWFHAPLYNCPKSHLYMTYITEDRFATATDDGATEEVTKSYILPESAKAEGFTYEDLLYSVANPDLFMDITVRFTDGTEAEGVEVPPYDDQEADDADQEEEEGGVSPKRESGLNPQDADEYLRNFSEQVMARLNPDGNAKEIAELIVTCSEVPFRWMTFPQIITHYHLLGMTQEEHAARQLYFWFLYSQMTEEEQAVIAEYTRPLLDGLVMKYQDHVVGARKQAGGDRGDSGRKEDDRDDPTTPIKKKRLDSDPDAPSAPVHAGPRGPPLVQGPPAYADDRADLVPQEHLVKYGREQFRQRALLDEKNTFDRRDRKVLHTMNTHTQAPGQATPPQLVMPFYTRVHGAEDNALTEEELLQKYHNIQLHVPKRTDESSVTGSFGTVYRICNWKNCSYVLKVFRYPKDRNMSRLLAAVYEATCHMVARARMSRYVTDIYDIFAIDSIGTYIVYERADMALFDLITEHWMERYGRDFLELPVNFFRDIFEAFFQCWNAGCLHMDPRLENFLVSGVQTNDRAATIDGVDRIFLADWGSCFILDPNSEQFLHFDPELIKLFWDYICDPEVSHHETVHAAMVADAVRNSAGLMSMRDAAPTPDHVVRVTEAFDGLCAFFRNLRDSEGFSVLQLTQQLSVYMFMALTFCPFMYEGNTQQVEDLLAEIIYGEYRPTAEMGNDAFEQQQVDMFASEAETAAAAAADPYEFRDASRNEYFQQLVSNAYGQMLAMNRHIEPGRNTIGRCAVEGISVSLNLLFLTFMQETMNRRVNMCVDIA